MNEYIDIYFLLAGLILVIYSLYMASKEGFCGIFSIRFLSILFIWVGYHLSPWISYFNDYKWGSFLLVKGYVNEGLLFSLLSMSLLILTYGWLKVNFKRRNFHVFPSIKLLKVNLNWIIVIMTMCLIVFTINVGGIGEIFTASYERGEGQFAQRGYLEKINHMVRVLSVPLYTLLACMASVVIIQEKKLSFLKLMGFLALIVSSLESFHEFSRSAGYPFLIFSFLVIRNKGRKGMIAAFLSILLVFYLGSIGMNERKHYKPGLYNYFLAIISSDEEITISSKTFSFQASNNPLDSMAPWTRKVSTKYIDQNSPFKNVIYFIWNLHPLPSELVPIKKLGRDLSEVMGTYGYTWITTPALSELYYVFGMYGVLFMIPLGRIYLYFDNQTIHNNNLVSTFCIILCFLSLPIGLHSSVRAMTRPLLYSFIILYISKNYKKMWFSTKLS